MDIKYYPSEETGRVYAIGTGKCGYAEGIDPAIADTLVACGFVAKKDLCVPMLTRGVAKVQQPDVFDLDTGKHIARDKVLRKHYAQVGKALGAYHEALDKLVGGVSAREAYCRDKVANAEKRLDAIG